MEYSQYLIWSQEFDHFFHSSISKNKVLLQLPNFTQPTLSDYPVNFPGNLQIQNLLEDSKPL